jgi:Domain of unknown function (DUF3806)
VDANVGTPTESQQAWLRAQVAAAAQFTADYGSPRTAPGLPSLDHAWASWVDRQSVEPADPEPVLNAVGVGLGEALLARLPDFRWVRVIEDGQENLALLGPPSHGDVLIYPADLVAAQYEARGGPFLVDAVDQIVAEVSQLNA